MLWEKKKIQNRASEWFSVNVVIIQPSARVQPSTQMLSSLETILEPSVQSFSCKTNAQLLFIILLRTSLKIDTTCVFLKNGIAFKK